MMDALHQHAFLKKSRQSKTQRYSTSPDGRLVCLKIVLFTKRNFRQLVAATNDANMIGVFSTHSYFDFQKNVKRLQSMHQLY